MMNHKITAMSESEEMYLITIARLVEQGAEDPVSISRIASELSIQPISANQMVYKLADEGFVNYFPYKGVQLTPKGERAALQVLRDRRLWEVFLVKHLELAPSEADALACRFEHITPKEVAGHLARFLGHPSFTPQGLPIPDGNFEIEIQALQPLTDLGVGEWAEVVRIEGDQATRAFLESEGLRAGQEVCPQAVSSGGTMLLKVGESRIHLSGVVANNILITFQRDRH